MVVLRLPPSTELAVPVAAAGALRDGLRRGPTRTLPMVAGSTATVVTIVCTDAAMSVSVQVSNRGEAAR